MGYLIITSTHLMLLRFVQQKKSMHYMKRQIGKSIGWVQLKMAELEECGYLENPYLTTKTRKKAGRTLTPKAVKTLEMNGLTGDKNE